MTAIARGSGDAASPAASSFLLRLYPAAWRSRYGDEFVELLEARPPSLRDRLDIVVGAVDARMSPQVVDQLPPRIASGRDRLLALAAVAAGALMTFWAGIIVVAEPRWGTAASLDESLIGLSYGAGMVGMLLAVVVLLGVASRYSGELGALGSIGALTTLGALLLVGTNAAIVGALLLPLGTLMFGSGLARITPWPVAVLMVGGAFLMTLAMFGFVASSGQQVLWLTLALAYGPSWMLLGVSLRHGPRAEPVALAGA